MTRPASEIRRVLVVEDNPGDARLVMELLREAFRSVPEVATATSVAEAGEQLAAGGVDLVLLDLSLPDSQGTATVASVRAADHRVPIVVLTGLEDEEIGYDALKKGAQDYLVKGSIDVPVLERALRYAVHRKLLEGEIRHSISLLQATLESTADGILVVDADGRLRNANRRVAEIWSTEASQNEIPDDRWVERLIAELREPERFRARLLSPVEEPTYDLLEFTDGRVYEALSVPHVLDALVIGRVWSFRDVTERRRAIEELRRARLAAESANRAKSEFLAELSHEIRTPLNTALGAADLLAETPLGNPQREYVDILRRAGQALLGVVNDVLDLSKIDAGRLDLERIPFSLDQVVTGVIQMLSATAAGKGISLRVDMPADIAATPVLGDPQRVRQILLNLASNAIKFTEHGGVTVSVARDVAEDAYRFVVSDTGIGIPKENLEAIFETFRQVDSSVARQYGGTGLGLGIARRLVELMRGHIGVDSEVGRGSRFHFVIHLAPAPEPGHDSADAASPSRDARPTVADATARILLADDSADNRKLIGYYLKGHPYELDLAENGEVAFHKFQSGAYDLVILDLQMPVLDGYQTVRKIRRWELERGRSPTPVVALTAYAIDEKIERSLENGCSGYLTKPVRRDRLLAALRTYLARH